MDFKSLDKCLGIELMILDKGIYSCRMTLLSLTNQEINVEKNSILEASLVSIINDLPKAYPVAITLTGKNIIHKSVEVLNDQKEDILFRVLPSINKDDFFIQCYKEEDKAFISFMRAEIANDILFKFKTSGINIIKFSLGAIHTVHIWDLIETSNVLLFDGHKLERGEDLKLKQYDFSSSVLDESIIENLKIPERNLLSYATAFQFLLNEKIDCIEVEVPQIQENAHLYFLKAKLKKYSIVLLSILFILLLISFLLFSYYSNRNSDLQPLVYKKELSEQSYLTYKQKTVKNQELLNSLGWNKGFNYSFLLIEISKKTPKYVTINEITFGKALYEQSTKLYSEILINGNSKDLLNVNSWIYSLQELEWIKNVKLIRFNEELDSGKFKFLVVIDY